MEIETISLCKFIHQIKVNYFLHLSEYLRNYQDLESTELIENKQI